MLPYSSNKNIIIINLFGEPSTGKSTTALGLAYFMKLARKPAEYISETAKDYVWEMRNHILTEQDYIFAQQNNKQRRLIDHHTDVKYIITDSPLPLTLMYMPKDFPQEFKPFVMSVFNSYTNINFLLQRRFDYDSVGRNQNEEESAAIRSEIMQFLSTNQIQYQTLESDINTAKRIFDMLFPDNTN
jgi:hypothetical protein